MDYMYERLHVPYPLTIEVNSHRVLSRTHKHVGSASMCKNDMPMQIVVSSIVHEQQSCRTACSNPEHRSCCVTDKRHCLQPSVSNLLSEAVQNMSVDLQTCDVVQHTQPVMTVIADASSAGYLDLPCMQALCFKT